MIAKRNSETGEPVASGGQREKRKSRDHVVIIIKELSREHVPALGGGRLLGGHSDACGKRGNIAAIQWKKKKPP